MSWLDSLVTYDILLNDAAFDTASTQLDELAVKMNTLRTDIENALNDLKSGFDTAAGAQFFKACGNKLLKPMEAQALVIEHVSNNLKTAKTSYASVFSEYEELNNTIKGYKQ